MKKVLVIGSTVADVIIRLDKLPTTGGDVNVRGQKCPWAAVLLMFRRP